MSNGKVRIYDLSRELNLENKDILAVCERLNIAVKSHSSTISEDDAERIRAAAEKHPAGASSTTVAGAVSPGVVSGREEHQPIKKQRPSLNKPSPPVKKQQILEVRRNKDIPGGATTAEEVLQPPQQVPLNRPTAPPPSPAKLVSPPTRAVRPALSSPPVVPILEAHSPETKAPTTPVPPSPPPDLPLPGPSTVTDLAPEPSFEQAPAVSLIQPPPRPQEQEKVTALPPQPPQNSASLPSPVPKQRPVLKRTKPEEGEGQEARREGARPRSLEVVVPGTSPRPTGPDGSGPLPSRPPRPRRSDAPSPSAPPVAPVPELRRPRPMQTTVARSDDSDGADLEAGKDRDSRDEIILDADGKESRRIAIPRAPKRAKKREEVDDEQEIAKKAAKLGAKGKRTRQVDEEDEDLDSLNQDDATPIQVNLSLLRPARPPKAPGQGTETIAAPRSRKFTGSRGGSRFSRRDRQTQEVKQERPEILSLTKEMTIQELAAALVVPDTEIVKQLFFKGIAVTVTQTLDIPTIQTIAEELGVLIETPQKESAARKLTEMLDEADLNHLVRRPPVVTIMGHVDHGKTSLLDSIRKTKVAQGEAGGITQHIGAYHVDLEHEGQVHQIVFLDTPGHEAFTAMRARGARVTDIAILVVAADDGVRPQTIEAISHAKAAGVPIVVAINKIDKEAAQPERVKQELMQYELVSEEWGGDTVIVPVSAITGENLDTLLEMLLLVAEVEELSANPNRPAKGTVVEAHLDKSKGPVATLLVQNGTLRVGDVLVAGPVLARVRAMVDDRGQRVDSIGPSFPVEILGLNDVPAAGDEFEVYPDEKAARAIADQRMTEQRHSRLQSLSSGRISLSSLSAKAQEGELKQLNLILKADVQGSVEAILGSLQQLPQNEVQIRVLLSAAGEITETDVDLAAASEAVIIGFNTTFASGAKLAVENAGVDVREYDVIYKLLEDIQGAMEGLLEPELVEEPLGQAEVRAVFPVGRGSVAGCYIQSGKIVRNCSIRVMRDGKVLHRGNLDSLRRMKDDVKEVNAGYECGLGSDSFNGWEEGDTIEAFRLVTKRRTLST